MDETREEIAAWVGLVAGAFFSYRGIGAIITGHATLGRRSPVHFVGDDAVRFGWIAFGVGFCMLTLTVAFFWNKRRR